MLNVGDKAIWRTKTWDGDNWVDNKDHPWYRHAVTIREVPHEGSLYPLYHFSVDDAPKVNDPKAFWFWDTADHLEKVTI